MLYASQSTQSDCIRDVREYLAVDSVYSLNLSLNDDKAFEKNFTSDFIVSLVFLLLRYIVEDPVRVCHLPLLAT